jgi:hypothetical protein
MKRIVHRQGGGGNGGVSEGERKGSPGLGGGGSGEAQGLAKTWKRQNW